MTRAPYTITRAGRVRMTDGRSGRRNVVVVHRDPRRTAGTTGTLTVRADRAFYL